MTTTWTAAAASLGSILDSVPSQLYIRWHGKTTVTGLPPSSLVCVSKFEDPATIQQYFLEQYDSSAEKLLT
jgi:hypothetical protein